MKQRRENGKGLSEYQSIVLLLAKMFMAAICRFMPKYFERDYSAGYANLTEEGWKAVKEELEESLSPAN